MTSPTPEPTRYYIVDLKKYEPCSNCGIKGFLGDDNWCSKPAYLHLDRLGPIRRAKAVSGVTIV
jgi:hypothetical protein